MHIKLAIGSDDNANAKTQINVETIVKHKLQKYFIILILSLNNKLMKTTRLSMGAGQLLH